MNLKEFQDAVNRTISPKGHNHFFETHVPKHYQENNPEQQDFEKYCDLMHAGLCIAGEAGEIADAIKKAMFYGKPLDEKKSGGGSR